MGEVFISFRASDGSNHASSVLKGLEARNVKAVCDLGTAAGALQDHSALIASCDSFVMVLTKGYLDSLLVSRSTPFKDLAAAIAQKKVIVPVYNPMVTSLPDNAYAMQLTADFQKVFAELNANALRNANHDEVFFKALIMRCKQRMLSKQTSSAGSAEAIKAAQQAAAGQDPEKMDALKEALKSIDLNNGVDEDGFRPSLSAALTLNAPKTPAPVHKPLIVHVDKRHVLKGHAESVLVLCFSPDSLTLSTGSEDRTVRLWDIATGNLKNIFTGHLGRVGSLCYIGSGTILFSGSKDKTIMQWDLLRNVHRRTMEGHTNVVLSLTVTVDGQNLISASHDETIRVWDIMQGKLLRTFDKGHTTTIYSIQLSPDGKQLVSCAGDKTIRIWDVASGRCLKTLSGHISHVTRAAWTPDGKRIISSSWDETLKLWDVKTGENTYTFTGHNGKVHCMVVAPDGETVISGGEDKTIRLWRIGNGECFAVLEKMHSEEILDLAIAPDQTHMASCSIDKTIRTYRISSM